MSRGKIRFAALISAMFVLFINICAFAKVDIPNHTDRFFINDYANVIDSIYLKKVRRTMLTADRKLLF